MPQDDIRWLQRFSNYKKAYAQLEKAVQLSEQRPLSDLEIQGLIQAFEFTHELAWNVMKDYFEYQGNFALAGSRDATKEAFKMEIIEDGDMWMEMIKSRNKTSHTYNETIALEIADKIIHHYLPLFQLLGQKMESLNVH
jgi:nucleotidyltransferase substrate binding protein (TIGR01987 family)